jgi:hypothetical protein
MSLLAGLKSLFGGGKSYALVWREQSKDGTTMKGEPLKAKSDLDALSLVRAKFKHSGSVDWVFWVLFRPNNSFLHAEQGPRFTKWTGEFERVSGDSHVQSALQSVRRHNKAVARPLRKVKLKSIERKEGPEEEELGGTKFQ